MMRAEQRREKTIQENREKKAMVKYFGYIALIQNFRIKVIARQI